MRIVEAPRQWNPFTLIVRFTGWNRMFGATHAARRITWVLKVHYNLNSLHMVLFWTVARKMIWRRQRSQLASDNNDMTCIFTIVARILYLLLYSAAHKQCWSYNRKYGGALLRLQVCFFNQEKITVSKMYSALSQSSKDRVVTEISLPNPPT